MTEEFQKEIEKAKELYRQLDEIQESLTNTVIIDGVDIAGCHNKTSYKNDYGDVQCKCYRFEDIENNTFLFGICKQHPNCYYKQLKRLEQENKELKEMLSKEPKAMQAFQISYGGLKRDNETLWGMVKDYKSALEEIKTIAEELCEQENCEEDARRYSCHYEDTKNILTKINEVLQ